VRRLDVDLRHRDRRFLVRIDGDVDGRDGGASGQRARPDLGRSQRHAESPERSLFDIQNRSAARLARGGLLPRRRTVAGAAPKDG